MKLLLVFLPVLLFSLTAHSQIRQDELAKILSQVLSNSSFNHDLGQINGLPAEIIYKTSDGDLKTIGINPAHVTKTYREVVSAVTMNVQQLRVKQRKFNEQIRFRLLFSDGTSARLKAVRYSSETGKWFLISYQIKGKELETGICRLFLRGEI